MDIREKMTLNFDDDFFKEEVRCEFKVTEKRKKVWAIQLDLLNEIIRVCKKYDIKMVVSCGTLLGTVRHKGFIPWDDDIDVSLLREDYEKLLKIASSEFKQPYFFQTALSDTECFVGYARLRNSLTTGLICGSDTPKYNNGIYIDVFVLDSYIEDLDKLQLQQRKKMFIETYINKTHYYIPSNSIIKRFLNSILHYSICKIVPYSCVIALYNKILKKYNNETERVSLMTHKMSFTSKYWCYKKDFDYIVWVPFEHITVPIPCNYDEILRRTYGDYMKFPPLEQRGTWHDNMLTFEPDIPYLEYFNNSKDD